MLKHVRRTPGVWGKSLSALRVETHVLPARYEKVGVRNEADKASAGRFFDFNQLD